MYTVYVLGCSRDSEDTKFAQYDDRRGRNSTGKIIFGSLKTALCFSSAEAAASWYNLNQDRLDIDSKCTMSVYQIEVEGEE